MKISGNRNGYVVLMEDGTIEAAGTLNSINGKPLPDWTDVVEVVANTTCVAVLKSDGTVEMVVDDDDIIFVNGEKFFFRDLDSLSIVLSEFTNVRVHKKEKKDSND